MKLRYLLLFALILCLPLAATAQKKPGTKAQTKPAVAAKAHAGKHMLPARNPKTGRFVKGTTATKATVKKLPARDPKTGRFVKNGAATKTTAKKLPARDPKTGRFIKSSAATKGGPARDPKTGRFIKKNGAKPK